MPTKTEIIEAGARALNRRRWADTEGEPFGELPLEQFQSLANDVERVEAVLSAMSPLLKELIASKIRGNDIKDAWPQAQDAYGYEEWFDVATEHAARQIERFEL